MQQERSRTNDKYDSGSNYGNYMRNHSGDLLYRQEITGGYHGHQGLSQERQEAE